MTMIERVAAAMGSEYVREAGNQDFLNIARAAIEAMREPTPEMTRGRHAGGEAISDVEAECIWEDMIDAALSDGEITDRKEG